MSAHSFQCPSCGAPLLPRGNASVISCPHCHTSVIVPEELREESDAAQWITLLFDNFSSNDNNWLVGSHTSEYFSPLNQVIADGRYRWEAETSKSSSISTSWLGGYRVADFHLIANSKHILGSKAGSSWGVIFRVKDNRNYYYFHMTDSQFFAVSVTNEGQWLNLVDWRRTEAIKSNGVNQLEVIARETHFIFLINGEIVSEIDDAHYSQGVVGVAIEGYRSGEKTIFDFLDFTLRGPREETLKNS
jgi:uncharacterized Zn finger protein (UPF0148 family)